MRLFRRLFLIFSVLILFGGSVYGVSRSQDIIDWWRLRDYVPTAEIEALASRAGFNDYGTKLFYVHDPVLLGTDSFRSNCTLGEVTIVLGCYISNQRIYIFDVEDDRLQGIEEVTAAHEMLHAAYDRLSTSSQEELNILLLQTFDQLENERIERTIASYRARDPSVVANELHSILGTEVRDLPVALEEHYAQYFTDRSIVVGFAEAYSDEFIKREEQIKSYDEQLSKLQGQIERLEIDIADEQQFLENERQRIEGLINNVELYNSQVSNFNQRVAEYNTVITDLRSLIDEFNRIVELRNGIADEERQLIQSLDSRASPL